MIRQNIESIIRITSINTPNNLNINSLSEESNNNTIVVQQKMHFARKDNLPPREKSMQYVRADIPFSITEPQLFPRRRLQYNLIVTACASIRNKTIHIARISAIPVTRYRIYTERQQCRKFELHQKLCGRGKESRSANPHVPHRFGCEATHVRLRRINGLAISLLLFSVYTQLTDRFVRETIALSRTYNAAIIASQMKKKNITGLLTLSRKSSDTRINPLGERVYVRAVVERDLNGRGVFEREFTGDYEICIIFALFGDYFLNA